MCKFKNNNVSSVQNDNNNVNFLGTLTINSLSCKSWQIAVLFVDYNKKLNFKIDTGAMLNVINYDLINYLNIYLQIEPSNDKLCNYNNWMINVVGKINLKCQIDPKIEFVEFFIVNCKSVPILGLPTLKKFDLLTESIKEIFEITEIRIFLISLMII